MKIIIGSESFAPSISGVAIATEVLATELMKSKNQVYVFAPDHPGKDDSEFLFKVIRFESKPNPFRNNFYVAKGSRKAVYAEFKKIKPDIVHLQDPTNIGTGLLKAAQKSGVAVVISNHFSLDYLISYLPLLKPLHGSIKYVLRKYLSSFYNHCDYVTCPTETVKNELLVWGVKNPIEAISNGVDLERFYSFAEPRDLYMKFHLPPNPLVLYVGRVDRDKNLEVLVEAVSKLDKSSNAHFVLVGGGDSSKKLKKMAAKKNIQNKISFLGEVPHNSPDLPLLYQVASLFVIPSACETQSKVTMEAMAAGLPIVGANSGALPELISHNQNGFLFEPSSSDDFAKKISHILKNQKLQKSMSKNSLKMITEHNLDESIGKIKKIYEKVLENRSKK